MGEEEKSIDPDERISHNRDYQEGGSNLKSESSIGPVKIHPRFSVKTTQELILAPSVTKDPVFHRIPGKNKFPSRHSKMDSTLSKALSS